MFIVIAQLINEESFIFGPFQTKQEAIVFGNRYQEQNRTCYTFSVEKLQ